MSVNPEIYKPAPKNWAYKPNHKEDQTWYCDGVFENGYATNLAFRFRESKCNAICEIGDPNGKLYGKLVRFARSSVVASTDEVDITMGENRIYREFPKYYAKFESDGVGLDLTYEAVTQEFMEPPDGCYVGRGAAPTTPVYYYYFFAPKCKISGNLIVDGKKIPVKNGRGYYDHQWGNAPFPDGLKYYYYWGKSLGSNHAIVWYDSQLAESHGYQRMKWLHAFKGDKLIQYSNSAQMYVETSDYTDVDQTTGLAFPRIVKLILDDPIVKGTLTYKMKYNFCDLYPRAWGPITIHRHVCECHAKLELDGEKVESDSMEFNELAIR